MGKPAVIRTVACPQCGAVREIKGAAYSYAHKCRSCGNRKHGSYMSGLYDVWRGMVGRCRDYGEQSERYYRRGIRLCAEWHGFVTFKLWAEANGWAAGLQIDRIDNDGDYEPTNCRFVTPTQNARNTSKNRNIEAFGKRQCLRAWAEEKGINPGTLTNRLNRGWSVEKALTASLQRGKRGY